jgi:hydrogenase maturation protease
VEETLIICVGNLARGDDGVGHEVARLLDARHVAATVVSATALDITLAERAAEARRLVIVDAARRTDPPVTVSRLSDHQAPRHTHALSPEGLVGLTASLFGAEPPAWIVSVAAPEMKHGAELSETAHKAAMQAADMVAELVSRPLAD